MDPNKKIIKEPLISILMLTYNRAQYVKEAIQSVCSQSYKNWELIVIDDGSTDTTADVIQNFDDARIKYVQHKENLGLLARRSESISYATGTYTAVLDSDDVWCSKDKLSKQVHFMETHPDHVLLGSYTKLIDDTGAGVGTSTYATNDNAIRRWILTRNQFTHSSVLIRTTALLETAGYRTELAEDLDLFLQLGTRGKLANLPEFLTCHRVHDGNENDHGKRMLTAVLSIIRTHSGTYPYSHWALFKNRMQKLFSHVSW